MARLTSVANVKTFLAIPTANQDVLISQLIDRESGLIERRTSRTFGYRTQSRVLNGTGTQMLVLPDDPVRAVTALTIGTTVQNPANVTTQAAGYMVERTAIVLTAGKFPQGFGNVQVAWESGWRCTGDATLPAAIAPDANLPTELSPVSITVANMTFNAALFPDGELDVGFPMAAVSVMDGNGVTFNQVAPSANGPLAGEFSFAAGVWTFNGSMGNLPVACLFDYCPAPIEQACIEMVGLDLKQRDNMGISSKTLAGESVSYEKSGMPASVKELLNPFIKRTVV